MSVSYRYDTLSRVTAVTYPPLATMIAALLAVARIPAFWHAGNDKKMMN